MVKEGLPFVIVPALIVAVSAILQLWIVSAIFLLLALFMIYFFRDPDRVVPTGKGLIVSAADGRVTKVQESADGKLVSVFLSPFDVHINRAPIAGRIEKIEYTKGKKIPATNNDASLVNERNSLVFDADGVQVTCTQIAGILARRIVCWASTGDDLERGQRFGLIKFSSRTDLLMPADVEIKVKLGDKVRGGETVIARINAD